MQVQTPPAQPSSVLLDSLPDIDYLGDVFPRRARVQIDLLLLSIEALLLSIEALNLSTQQRSFNGSEAIFAVAQELGLQEVIKGRVTLWKLRSANPLRRHGSQRKDLSMTEAKALVVLISDMAKRLRVRICELLLANQQLADKGFSPDHHYLLGDYLTRFRAHFRSRMNPNRAAVAAYSDERLNELALTLLSQLLFCTGVAGTQRLWFSLFDGEVA
ncbi:MAG TPA: DUF3038 domain-containing protein [Synechococcales cyanobacterium M55_K2018_004]|nr:DUF3038 domain-containing protein [Synechococcales cyanobacterium M55_K2018_004]